MNITMPDETTVRIYGADIGNPIEIRGAHPYGVRHVPSDPVHAFLDACDPASVALLMSGDDLFINPKNTRRAATIKAVGDVIAGL